MVLIKLHNNCCMRCMYPKASIDSQIFANKNAGVLVSPQGFFAYLTSIMSLTNQRHPFLALLVHRHHISINLYGNSGPSWSFLQGHVGFLRFKWSLCTLECITRFSKNFWQVQLNVSLSLSSIHPEVLVVDVFLWWFLLDHAVPMGFLY